MPAKSANCGSAVGSKRPSSPVPADDAPDKKRSTTECRRIAKQQLKLYDTHSPFVALYGYLTDGKSEGDVWVALDLARLCGICNHARLQHGPMQFGNLRVNVKQAVGWDEKDCTKTQGPTPLSLAIFANRIDLAELIVKEEDFRPDMISPIVGARNSTVMHLCAASGNTDGIKFLVAHGADIESPDKLIGTPLTIASDLGHSKVVELLISLGAKVSSRALYLSARSGHLDIMRILLDSSQGFIDIDINRKYEWGRTSLHFAAMSARNVESAKLLISHGACLNVKCDNGQTCLHTGAKYNSESLVSLLLDLGADVDEMDDDGTSPLLAACQCGHDSVASALLENGAQVALIHKGWGPLSFAARQGCLGALRMIVKRYPTTLNSDTARSEWADDFFHTLINNDSAALILIEHGADVNAVHYGKYPLQLAVSHFGQVDVVNALLTKGADISVAYEGGLNALRTAVATDRLDFVNAIVDARGYEALEAESSNPPWLEAARTSQLEMFRALVRLTLSGSIDIKTFLSRSYPCIETDETEGDAQRGANVSGTVLHFAAYLNDVETIELLVNSGADANIVSEFDGSRPLHVAVRCNATACVNVLVAKGADMNAVDKLGNTPLQTACTVLGALGTPLEALIRLGASWQPQTTNPF